MIKNTDKKQSDIGNNIDAAKRESLIKMGKRAAYISPVVLTLLTSQKASALSPPPPPPPPP